VPRASAMSRMPAAFPPLSLDPMSGVALSFAHRIKQKTLNAGF
jgi:hypothetical protein